MKQLVPIRLQPQTCKNLIFKRDPFRVVLLQPSLGCISVREDLQVIAVANLLMSIDIRSGQSSSFGGVHYALHRGMLPVLNLIQCGDIGMENR